MIISSPDCHHHHSNHPSPHHSSFPTSKHFYFSNPTFSSHLACTLWTDFIDILTANNYPCLHFFSRLLFSTFSFHYFLPCSVLWSQSSVSFITVRCLIFFTFLHTSIRFISFISFPFKAFLVLSVYVLN